jgi:hypothetical protein
MEIQSDRPPLDNGRRFPLGDRYTTSPDPLSGQPSNAADHTTLGHTAPVPDSLIHPGAMATRRIISPILRVAIFRMVLPFAS